MRKIYPIDCQSTLLPVNCKPITEQQYNDLVEQVGEAKDLANAVSDELEQTKSELETSVATCDITATNVNANDIVADTVQADSLSTTTISSPYLTSDSTNTTVNGDLVVNGRAVTNCIMVTDSTATNLTATCASIDNLTTGTFNPEIIDTCVLTANDITATCVTATEASIDNVIADSSTISTANIATANITEAEVSCVTIQEETVQTSTIDCLDNKYLTHTNEPQHISETGDIYIVLPKFTNGTYVLEGENDGGTKLFSIEFDNSQENVRFKWSVNTQTYLKDVEFINDVDGVQFVQLHAYTFGEEITLYFHSDSLDNTNPPQVYTSRQYEGVKKYEFSTQSGTYLPNSVFAGTFHAESMVVDDTEFQSIIIDCNVCLPTGYDIYGCPIGHTNGQPGQYITPVELDNGDQGIKWESPATSVERGNTKLITSDGVSCYDGKVCVCEDGEGNPVYEYPIKELNECTTVHGTITTDNAVVCNNFNTTNVTDIAEDVDAGICAELRLNNPMRASDCCFFTPTGSLCNGKPVVYNCECDVLETADNINIDEATFDKLTVNCAYIQELHAVTEVQQETTGDYITTRANNDSSLTNSEYSGVLVNNYDGSNVAGIVVDCNGTLRVGDGSKTDTTYTDIYYADNKWYSDAELTTEITPSGQLTGWESRTETEDYIHYVNAIFSVVSFTDYQPVLTRDESTNMTDKALIQWDATNNCAATIAAPTANEQVLCACITEDPITQCPVTSYCWTDKQAGVYCFETMACYNAYTGNIPEGSIVMIAECNNYITGEDQ